MAAQIRGAALVGQRKFDESIQVLHSAHSAAPTAVQPMAMLVGAYLRLGERDEAEAFVRSVLLASPKNADAWVLLGALQAAHSFDEAKTSFDTAIRSKPENFRGYAALANLYLRRDQQEEAIAALPHYATCGEAGDVANRVRAFPGEDAVSVGAGGCSAWGNANSPAGNALR